MFWSANSRRNSRQRRGAHRRLLIFPAGRSPAIARHKNKMSQALMCADASTRADAYANERVVMPTPSIIDALAPMGE
eukprot:2113196-Pleurochrysis_carterae.AAC.1